MSKKMDRPYRVGFLSRGSLGYHVMCDLLRDPNVDVPVIFTCSHTPEVGESETAFEQAAMDKGIPFYVTNNINKREWIEILKECKLDLAVAMLWVNTISAPVIKTAKEGFLNLHGGKLPRYRGNACSTWAILNGESEIGVTVHLMEPDRLDSGPVVLQEMIPVAPDAKVSELIDEVYRRGARMVTNAVRLFRLGLAPISQQDEDQALRCYPRLPRDGEIDWNKSADNIWTLVRAAGRPYPGAFCYFSDVFDKGRIKKLTIWAARVVQHPTNFCAVPGHVLLDLGEEVAVVCGDGKLLVLEEIDIDGIALEPVEALRSARQRLDIDTETLIRLAENGLGR